MLKPHYFDQEKADDNDVFLKMAIQQGYVPKTCLLNGQLVWALTNDGKDACKGCACNRGKCHGRPS